jgi:hypothetical protein
LNLLHEMIYSHICFCVRLFTYIPMLRSYQLDIALSQCWCEDRAEIANRNGVPACRKMAVIRNKVKHKMIFSGLVLTYHATRIVLVLPSKILVLSAPDWRERALSRLASRRFRGKARRNGLCTFR